MSSAEALLTIVTTTAHRQRKKEEGRKETEEEKELFLLLLLPGRKVSFDVMSVSVCVASWTDLHRYLLLFLFLNVYSPRVQLRR